MKAAVFYILFICFGLLGMHNHAHATAHNGKLSFAATHNSIHKQQVDPNNFIDVEDENDDKDVSKKFTHQSRWISIITCALTVLDHDGLSENYLSRSRQITPTGSHIIIEQRVLRI